MSDKDIDDLIAVRNNMALSGHHLSDRDLAEIQIRLKNDGFDELLAEAQKIADEQGRSFNEVLDELMKKVR